LDFSQFPAFDRTRLYAVINITQNTPLYIAGAPGLGMSSTSAGSLVILNTSTATMASTDALNVYYETDAGLQVLENNDAAERNGNLDKISQFEEQILIELKVMNILLKEGLNIKDELEQLRADIQRDEIR
jgi:hypothetical protein